MGAWETGNFGNDDASDWIYDLEASSGTEQLRKAFTSVIAVDYPGSPDCCFALAAAEIVAAAKGRPAVDLPDAAQTWIAAQKKLDEIQALGQQAATVVNKISARSELRDLWEESDSWAEWQQVVEGLRQRLLN